MERYKANFNTGMIYLKDTYGDIITLQINPQQTHRVWDLLNNPKSFPSKFEFVRFGDDIISLKSIFLSNLDIVVDPPACTERVYKYLQSLQTIETINEVKHISPKPSVREQILQTALEATLKDRNSTHGNPEDNFATIAMLWNVYLEARFNDKPVRMEAYDVAVLNILQKISRVTTSPKHMDHWTDIAGYAACGAQCVAIREEE